MRLVSERVCVRLRKGVRLRMRKRMRLRVSSFHVEVIGRSRASIEICDGRC